MLIYALPLLLSAQTPTDASKVDKAKPQETAAPPPAAVVAPDAPPPPDFSHEAQGTLGGIFTNGNVDSIAARAGGYYQAKYLRHGLRVDAGFGVTSLAVDNEINELGQVAPDPSNGWETPLFSPNNKLNTAANLKGRYDFFITDNDSVYGAGLLFHDSAVNLQLRMRADAGYRRYFINSPKHSLTAEVGAVYTIDRAPFKGDTNADGFVDLTDEVSFEESNGTLGARVFVGYTNGLLDGLVFSQTLEVIPNIFPEVSAPFEAGDAALGIKARIDAKGDNKLGFGEATIAVSNSTLTYSLFQNLSIGSNLLITYDNGAIARRNAYTNHDVVLSLQLGYKFL